MKKGRLYGVGVGPGDPELMTLKAVRIIRECQVVAIPHSEKEKCVAYRIARQAVPEIEEKPCLFLPMPMTKDREILKKSHREAAEKTAGCLEKGENVAFITLGDSTVYSTCLYIHEQIRAMGFETELVNGVPSFCAAAAKFNGPLVNGSQELHIIPASYQIEEALNLPGVKVLMKAGRKMGQVKELLSEKNLKVKMAENCGMQGERCFSSLEEIPEEAGYYSLIIASDR